MISWAYPLARYYFSLFYGPHHRLGDAMDVERFGALSQVIIFVDYIDRARCRVELDRLAEESNQGSHIRGLAEVAFGF